MGLETSTVVEFGSGQTDYIFNVELDKDSNPESGTFVIGGSAVIQVNHSTNVSIQRVVATAGDLRRTGSVSRNYTEDVLFSGNTEDTQTSHTLKVSPNGGETVTYIGRTGALEKTTSVGNIVTLKGDTARVPFLASLDIPYTCELYRLTSPTVSLAADETYTIHIVFYIEVD